MSVLIKGMKMPKRCDDCWALDDYADYPMCRITEEQRGYNFPVRERRMDRCPLIEIPENSLVVSWNDKENAVQMRSTGMVNEVVRCKDCKHRENRSWDSPCPCVCADSWYSWKPEDDWFCANGERREE